MKIGFVTNYDESTESNYNIVCKSLPEDSLSLLLKEDATRDNFIRHLNDDTDADVFVFTHGNDDCFYANTDEIAYRTPSDTELKDRKIFVYACFTANALGKDTANLNSIYWGYTGPLAALADNDKSKHIFIPIVSNILNNFSTLDSKSDIYKYLDNLKQLCEDGQDQLYDIAEEDKDFDVMEGCQVLMHIWSRLRVYFKSENDKLLHPASATGDLF